MFLKGLLFTLFFLFAFGASAFAAEEPAPLPLWFLETHRIIDPNSALGRRFNEFAQEAFSKLKDGVTQRYPEIAATKAIPRFFLSDFKPGARTSANDPLKDFDAFFAPSAPGAPNAPSGLSSDAIVISKGALRYFQNTSEFLGIFGHEWVHGLLWEKYGEGGNSKLEETLADLGPLEGMYLAGYDPRAALELWKRIVKDGASRKDKRILARIGRLAEDVHMTGENRVSAIQKALAYLHQKYGGIEREREALPADLMQLLGDQEYLTDFERWSGENRFTEAAPAEKIRLITAYIQESLPTRGKQATTEELDLSLLAEARLGEIRQALKDMAVDFNDREQMGYFHELVRVVTFEKTDVARDRLYSELCLKKNGNLGRRPLGWMEAIQNALKRFRGAETLEQAQAAAHELLEQVDAHAVTALDAKFWQLMRWGVAFDMPDEGKVKKRLRAAEVENDLDRLPKVGWNKWVKWAGKDDSEEIRLALWVLGVPDYRIALETRKVETLGRMLGKYHKVRIADGLVEESMSSKKYVFDEEGRIRGLAPEFLNKEVYFGLALLHESAVGVAGAGIDAPSKSN